MKANQIFALVGLLMNVLPVFAENSSLGADPYYQSSKAAITTTTVVAGGAVKNTELKTVSCINVTTGKSMTIKIPKGVTSWNCAAAGFSTKAGDNILELLSGTVKLTPKSCKDILTANSSATNGVYTINPDNNLPFQVYCDMETDGGGWTLVDKTDGSSTADKTVDAVNTSALLSPALDTVAKFSDVTINAIQGGINSETRVESPTFATQLFVTGTKWSIVNYSGYPTVIQVRTSGNTYVPGSQCYDSDGTCSTDHYCFGKLPPTADWGEHICIRRFNTAGIWFNSGSFNGSYQPGRVWIR